MHVHQLKWLVALIALAWIAEAAADPKPDTWTGLMMTGKRLNDRRYYLKALSFAQKFGEDDPRFHMSLQVAAFQHRIMAPKLSEALFKKDITVLERIDVDFPAITQDLYELSRIFNQEGRYVEAEAQLKRALAIRNKWQD